MLNTTDKIIKHKVGLLNLAEELGNISKACQIMGTSRDTFYRYKNAVDEGGVEALFERTRVEANGKNKAVVHGRLTLHGVTRDIAINADYIGGGKDPWGGFRQGFSGTTRIALADYGIKKILGPASKELELNLHIEGIRQ